MHPAIRLAVAFVAIPAMFVGALIALGAVLAWLNPHAGCPRCERPTNQ